MTTRTHRRTELSRLAIAGAFLLAGLAGTAQAASAAGPPLVDDGGSGGGNGESSGSIFLEHFGLVPTNGGPGSFSMQQAPVLVGSGPEREIVDDTDGLDTAGTLDETARATDLIALGGTLDGPTLVGSGPEREIVADADAQVAASALDETARSTDLIALSPGAATETALDTTAARRGQPF